MTWLGRRRGLRLAPDAAELDRQELSWAELRAGRLPLAAQDRLAAQVADQVFTSDLSTADLVALRSAGYEPVGQAFGASSYGVSTTMQSYARYAVHPAGAYGASYATYPRPTYSARTISRNAAYRQPPPVGATAIPGYHDAANSARARALSRLLAECTGLGADGILGVRIEHTAPQRGLDQITMIGTAVRERSRPGPTGSPFSTTLGAVDVSMLRTSGWRPTALLYERQRYGGHGGYVGTRAGRLNPLNYASGEIVAGSAVTAYAGARTRTRLHAQLPAGGGMILDRYDVDLDREECSAYDGYTDFVVDVEAIGTAIEPVRAFTVSTARPRLTMIPVVRLSDD